LEKKGWMVMCSLCDKEVGTILLPGTGKGQEGDQAGFRHIADSMFVLESDRNRRGAVFFLRFCPECGKQLILKRRKRKACPYCGEKKPLYSECDASLAMVYPVKGSAARIRLEPAGDWGGEYAFHMKFCPECGKRIGIE
jgi:hypothetical protein